MLDEKQALKFLRGAFSKQGWALTLYYVMMSIIASAVVVFDVLISGVRQGIEVFFDEEALAELIMSAAANGWGYIITCLLGGVLLLVWKKKDFCLRQIWVSSNRMQCGSFFSLLSIFLACQALFQVYAIFFVLISQYLDESVMDTLEIVTSGGDSFSMFLYAGIFAPIFEEILFRGLLLRSFQPYGKKFAIFASAVLFGLYHGNIIQTPFAVVFGLLLGYVTAEYSIGWAMLLHMVNNLVLGDILPRALAYLPVDIANILFYGILAVAFVASVVIVVVKRDEIRKWHQSGKLNPICIKAFFTSPGILFYSVMMLISIVALL